MNQMIMKLLEKDQAQFLRLVISAFNALEDFVYLVGVNNETLTYLFANQTGLNVLSKDTSIIGRTFDEVLQGDKAKFLKRYYIKAAKYQKVVTFEDELELADGQIIYCETVLTPIIDQDDIYIIAIVRDITEKSNKLKELQRSKRLLEKNEQRLFSLMEYNEDAVFMFDRNGFFLDVNPATERITGYKSTELIGMNFSKIMEENETARVWERFQRVMKGEPVRYESFFYHKDGREVYINVKSIPITVEGEIVGIYGIARDITKEKQTIEEFQKIKLQLESFLQDSADAIAITNLKGEVEFINKVYTKTYGYTEEEVLGKENPIIPDWLVAEKNEMHKQAAAGEVLKGIHVKRQKKTGELLDVSLTMFPLYDECGNVIAVSSIGRDITEDKKTQLEMVKTKEELELVWNYTTNGICMIGFDGRIRQANPAFARMFGWKHTEISQMTLSCTYLEHQQQQMDEVLSQLRHREEPIQFQTKRKRKDGTILEIQATYRPIKKGKILALVTYKNVTEENRILLSLKESEERYRKVLESSPEGFIIHTDGIITYINHAGLEFLKARSSNQVLGKPLNDFVHKNHRKQLMEKTTKIVAKGEIVEAQFTTLAGDEVWAEAASALIKEAGRTHIVTMFRDVTKKRRAEQALKESEERFRIIAEHSKDLIKIVKPDGKISYVSPSLESILGYPIRAVIGKSLLGFIHQDDLEAVESTIEKVKTTNEVYDIEIRHVHQDGHAIWLHSHISSVLSANGELEKIIVISSDITESKRKHEELTEMAFYDFLTGLPNRRLLQARLKQAMLTSEKTGNLTALFILDCDKFKKINDTLGHDIGDEVIIEFARRIKSSLRKKDTISRIGGDEFAVVLPEISDENEIVEVAKRMSTVLREEMYLKGHQIQVTASIGIALYPTNAKDEDQLYKEADNNLYRVKERGGNSFSMSLTD